MAQIEIGVEKLIVSLMLEEITDRDIEKLEKIGFNVVRVGKDGPQRIISVDFDRKIVIVGSF